MRYNIICYLFLIVLLTDPVCASEVAVLDTYTHTVEMGPDDSFHEINALVIVPGTLQEIILNLPPRTEKLQVFVDENRCDFMLEEKKGYSVVTCKLPDDSMTKHFISITYYTDYPIFELQNKVMYNSEFIPSYNTSKFNYILKLPVGYIIPDEKEVSFFVHPEPRSIYSDGQRIILLWEQRNVDSNFEISVMMEPTGASSSNILLLIGTLALLILFGAGYRNYSKKRGRKNAVIPVSYPALVEHEKVVVDLLEKADGNVMWQKQIQVGSGFSKVKVSRVLQSLEKRGVIRKEAWGNTNKIHLITEHGVITSVDSNEPE
ncbi:MAG: hypothetical protein M8353_03495 [ANME-2 cluster archaeon]|nr:hypothetical protein [ANME-2 cluster archaeon]